MKSKFKLQRELNHLKYFECIAGSSFRLKLLEALRDFWVFRAFKFIFGI
jgi:hypothetical protein